MNVHCCHDELVDPHKLVEHPRNPNSHPKGQIKLLAKIIDVQGWRQPITVSRRSGYITKGHGRLAAGLVLKHDAVPVDYQDYDNEADEYADMIADNRIAELAEIESDTLKDLLIDMDDGSFDMDLTGFDNDALEDLLAPIIDPDDIEEDEAPEMQEDAITEVGRIYQLGKHRLMCGDSTSEDDVGRLMDGEKADMVFTDPPYNVAGESRNFASDVSTAMGRLADSDWDKGFNPAATCKMINEYTKKDATCYIWTSHFLFGEVIECVNQWADFSSYCVWSKPNPMPSLSKRHWTWNTELCVYATKGSKRVVNFPDGEHALSCWLDVKKSDGSHPTQKPIGLCERPIQFSSKVKGLILDLFGGSGSTLIACEQTKRSCYMMELDPRYCDVIVRRYAKLVGADADEIFEKGYHDAS